MKKNDNKDVYFDILLAFYQKLNERILSCEKELESYSDAVKRSNAYNLDFYTDNARLGAYKDCKTLLSVLHKLYK